MAHPLWRSFAILAFAAVLVWIYVLAYFFTAFVGANLFQVWPHEVVFDRRYSAQVGRGSRCESWHASCPMATARVLGLWAFGDLATRSTNGDGALPLIVKIVLCASNAQAAVPR